MSALDTHNALRDLPDEDGNFGPLEDIVIDCGDCEEENSPSLIQYLEADIIESISNGDEFKAEMAYDDMVNEMVRQWALWRRV